MEWDIHLATSWQLRSVGAIPRSMWQFWSLHVVVMGSMWMLRGLYQGKKYRVAMSDLAP